MCPQPLPSEVRNLRLAESRRPAGRPEQPSIRVLAASRYPQEKYQDSMARDRELLPFLPRRTISSRAERECRQQVAACENAALRASTSSSAPLTSGRSTQHDFLNQRTSGMISGISTAYTSSRAFSLSTAGQPFDSCFCSLKHLSGRPGRI